MFNLSKFNVKNNSNMGLSVLNIRSEANSTIEHIFETEAVIKIFGTVNETFEYFEDGKAFSRLVTLANATIEKLYESSTDLVLTTSAISEIFCEHALALEKINLKPGENLVINTCDMTVLVRGQNGVRYLSADSEFFKFLNGENIIVYADNANERDVYIDVIWKDKYV